MWIDQIGGDHMSITIQCKELLALVHFGAPGVQTTAWASDVGASRQQTEKLRPSVPVALFGRLHTHAWSLAEP